MGSFIIGLRVPANEIREEIQSVSEQMTQWFVDNPKRRTCKAEIWQGQVFKIRKSHIAEDVQKAAEDIIADNVASGYTE